MAKKSNKKSNKKKNYNIFISLGLIVVVLAGYLILSNGNGSAKTNTNIKSGDYKEFEFSKEGELSFQDENGKFISQIDIEIAQDAVKRAVGLMYRERLNENQGMLFIFQHETYQSFWMKNTVLPLDIIFVNKNKEIVTIYRNTTPFSEESYPSTKPAIYVVEVNAGYTSDHGIKEGDKISWRVM